MVLTTQLLLNLGRLIIKAPRSSRCPRIEWQLNPNDNKIVINIPANTSYQGECSSNDNIVSKLTFINSYEPESLNKINYLFNTVNVLKSN